MKEQLTAELLKLLQSVNSAAGGAGDFLKQKVPELCQQIINWEYAFHIFFSVVFMVAIVIGSWCVHRRLKQEASMEEDGDVDILWLVSWFGVATGVVFFIVNVVSVIYVITSPDLVVLDYFRSIR